MLTLALFCVSQGGSTMNAIDCVFSSNTASDNGGAIVADVRVVYKYGASENMLCKHLTEHFHGIMEMQWDTVQKFYLLFPNEALL